MSIYDAIDTTRFIDDNVYMDIVSAISKKTNLKYTLEKAIKEDGAFLGLVNTFDLKHSLPDYKLKDLEERLR